MTLHTGMNRRELDRVLWGLGGRVETIPGTGEIRYSHPALGTRSVRANGRRKDASKELVGFVKQVIRINQQEAAQWHP